jgi:hypothetical protein
MSSSYIAPLNLKYIFQNVFAGSPEIFFAIFVLAFSILAGYFRMGSLTYVMLLALGSILLYSWLGGGLYLLVIFIGGLLIFWVISKLVKE